jgi:hypothetical protein
VDRGSKPEASERVLPERESAGSREGVWPVGGAMEGEWLVGGATEGEWPVVGLTEETWLEGERGGAMEWLWPQGGHLSHLLSRRHNPSSGIWIY